MSDKKYKAAWIKAKRKERKDTWFAENGPCRVCGSWEDLQLDHVDPSQKVTHRVWSWSAAFRRAELAKCQALCKECHKTKTIQLIKKQFPIVHGTWQAYSRKGLKCRCKACRRAYSVYSHACYLARKGEMVVKVHLGEA